MSFISTYIIVHGKIMTLLSSPGKGRPMSDEISIAIKNKVEKIAK